MSTTEPTAFEEIFPGLARDPSVRTYSHKRGNNVPGGLLPKLKPTPVHRPTRRPLIRVSPEPQPQPEVDEDALMAEQSSEDALLVSTNQPSDGPGEDDQRGNESYPYEVEYADDTVDDERDHDSEEASPALRHKPRKAPPGKRVQDEYDLEDSEDELVKNVTSSITDPVRPTPAPRLTTSVRRRSNLTLKKPPIKYFGYKEIERKKSDGLKKTGASYIPGDGFSDDEARPNGLFHLTKKRKLHYSVPAVGALDLTGAPAPKLPNPTPSNSATQPKEPRIIFKRRKRVHDNSFLPPTPKKVRQERDRERASRQKKNNEARNPSENRPRENHVTVTSAKSAPHDRLVSSDISGGPMDNESFPALPPVVAEATAEVEKDGDIDPKDDEMTGALLPILDHGDKHAQIEKIQDKNVSKEKETVVPFSDFMVEETQYTRSQSVPATEPIQKVNGSTSNQRPFRRVKTN
ncbi:hypothetical protein V8F20_005477 [Naviculisporaceae sp. PSN 640]